MKKPREGMVRQRFSKKVGELLPQFERASFGEHWPDLLCYRWKIDQGFTCYVTLRIHERDDRFDLLLAWLLTDREPIYATPGAPDSEPNRDGLSIDLNLLWSHHAIAWKVKYMPPAEELSAWLARNPAFGDVTQNQEAQRIFPRVDDAVGRVIEYGYPYLRSIAHRYGVTWPLPLNALPVS
jgi:hypothetical protein